MNSDEKLTKSDYFAVILFLAIIFIFGIWTGIFIEHRNHAKTLNQISEWCSNQKPLIDVGNNDRRPKFCKK